MVWDFVETDLVGNDVPEATMELSIGFASSRRVARISCWQGSVRRRR